MSDGTISLRSFVDSANVDVVVGGGAVAFALLLLTGLHFRRRRRRPQPPSVGRYPVIGSLRHLPEPWYRSLHEIHGHHPVVTMHMGMQKVYIFNQWEPFKEAMIDNAEQLTGRISQVLSEIFFNDVGGLVVTDGPLWQEYRRFSLRVLRDFGFGRKGGERMIVEEAEHLCRNIDAAEGAASESGKLMGTATSNIICQLVFGSRLASEDPKFNEILELFRAITQNANTSVNNCIILSLSPLVERFRFLAPLFTMTSEAKEEFGNFLKLTDYCERHRQKRAADMENVDRARDYIEAHLIHQKNNPDVFNDTRLTLAISDLFLAGTDTTANTLRWAILFMIDNPDVADKTHREIVEAIGRERLPEMKDKQQLPYVQAVIEEVMRRSSLVPLGLLHRVTDTVTVGGYELEKDSVCAFNVYAIHHDPRAFPNPTEFRPDRHLKDGQFVACERLSAFGIGKRACLGESLARMELFIFFTTLMQRYKFSLDPEDPRTVWDLTEDPKLYHGCLLRAPPLHKIVFTRR